MTAKQTALVGPRLNVARVNKFKVDYVVSLRAILMEVSKVNRSPENLRAAEEVAEKLTSALGPSTL